jgi:hypothetical protein
MFSSAFSVRIFLLGMYDFPLVALFRRTGQSIRKSQSDRFVLNNLVQLCDL